MNNFLIGMYGKFDIEKFERDFHNEFFGIEICSFNDIEQVKSMVTFLDDKKIGIHYPLIKNEQKTRDPLFLSLNKDEKSNAYIQFENQLIMASQYNPDYLLVHFPKPVIIDNNIDWSCWRFANTMEWEWTSNYPYEKFLINVNIMFDRLSQLSKTYNIKILLENDAFNHYLYKGETLKQLLCKYPEIKLCIDLGRTHLLQQVDKNFDSFGFISQYAQYTYLIHLWNTTLKNNTIGGHYPALPYLSPDEGWGDMGKYLSIICSINKNVKVLFEHRSELISKSQLEECYNWVNTFFM